MEFKWKINNNIKKTSFDNKIHNLACFEVVLNILKMKCKAKDSTDEEVQALCNFALNCMFDKKDLNDEHEFDSIMVFKDAKVTKIRNKLLKEMGVPESIMDNPQIGEA